MAILKEVFEITSDADVSETLGNILISGANGKGLEKLFKYMLMDLLHEKKLIVLANGSLMNNKREELERFIRPHMKDGRSLYEWGPYDTAGVFDVMSAFKSSERRADFVISLLEASGLSGPTKDKAAAFYRYAVKALDLLGKRYRIKDLCGIRIEAVRELVLSAPLPDDYKDRGRRFLEDGGIYGAYFDIQAYMDKLDNCGILSFLSGDRTAGELLREGNVLMLNGMSEDEPGIRELCFNMVFHTLSKCLEEDARERRTAFLVRGADFIAGDTMKGIMEYNAGYPCAAYIFAEDISSFVAKNGNTVLDDAGAYIVFAQGSNTNAEFWSTQFGSREVHETDVSYTQKKSWNPLASLTDSGGVVPSQRKHGGVTTGYHKVYKPIYLPMVFSGLQENEAMILMRKPLKRKKVKIEV